MGDKLKLSKKPELLSPAGTIESVKAAVNSGCSAVYIGGKSFSARKYASNFSDEELKQIIEYCHLRNVSVFITLNILYKDNEIKPVLKFVSKVYEYGADALIIQDIGIFSIIKNTFPDIKLHASTQMTIHNLEGAKKLEKIGFDRIVLSRELSLNEIKEISNNINSEIECFVHGALCVCYSGRCLMSSLNGGRSGNRGSCAQPCRMKYDLIKDGIKINNDYILSPKDIMTVKIIDKLIESGINSFKIEGRMKSPEYVAEVTQVYRKYIDMYYESKIKYSQNDINELTQIFNRGGSSAEGYYTNWGGNSMMSSSPKSSGTLVGVVSNYNNKTKRCTIKLNSSVIPGDGIEIWTKKEPHTGTNISKNAVSGETIEINIDGFINKGDKVYKSFDKKLNDRLKNSYSKDTGKQTVNTEIKAEIDKPLYIKLISENGVCIESSGEIIKEAQNQPLAKDKLINQITKTGNTPFSFKIMDSKIDNNIYIPISSINELRRNACEKLEKAITEHYSRISPAISYGFIEKARNEIIKPELTVSVRNKEQFDVAVKYNISRIYIELNDYNLNNLDYYISGSHNNGIKIFISLLKIQRNTTDSNYKEIFNILENSDIDGYLIRNYSEINTKKELAADYTFNIFNTASLSYLNYLYNIESAALSPELNINELKSLCCDKTELIIYGHLTVMTTHQCPVGNFDSTKESGMYCKLKGNSSNYKLIDRKNYEFPIITDCANCTAEILSSQPIFILSSIKEILQLNTKYLRLIFTTESAEETKEIISAYIESVLNKNISTDTKKIINKMQNKGYTNGHFNRGVQ